MVIDYSERRQQRRTPPKRPSVWPSVLLILALTVVAFLAGLGTGWYLFRPGGRLFKTPMIPAPAATKVEPPQAGQPPAPAPQPGQASPAPAAQQAPAPPAAAPPPDKAPPLTFYKTLPSGNKGLLGTGINPSKEGQGGAPKPAPAPAAAAPER
jgi:hypothetical protein